MKLDPQAVYIQLGRLLEAMPELVTDDALPKSTYLWLGKAHALLEEMGRVADASRLAMATKELNSQYGMFSAADEIKAALYRALAKAELDAPASAQGAFIPAGNAFDGFAAVGKVLSTAKTKVLIIDPYLDEKVLTDFAPLAAEGILISLMADQQFVKPSLSPAVSRWAAQHGAKRPIEAKLAPPRALHDRLIIVDGAEAWDLTQSLNAFAARSPATIVRSGPDQASLKIPYYESVWASAAVLT
jgi:hypothetical protein